MAKGEFVHLMVERLSAESMRRGVINPAGLDDKELETLTVDCIDMMVAIRSEVRGELHRRKRIREDRSRKVRPLPGCGKPEHYWEK